MESKLCLTSFTRHFDYPKLCDIWSSKIYFSKFKFDNFYQCSPSCFFVYSSRFYFKNSLKKAFNLVITLVYDFKPIIIKIIPFPSLITTLSFSKNAFTPILFIGEESGQICILNLDILDDFQFFRPKFLIDKSVQLADWLNEKFVIFSYPTSLYGWNIESGQIDLLYDSIGKKITHFICTSFQPSLVAIGHDDGEILIMNRMNDKFNELFKNDYHKNAICSLSFTIDQKKNMRALLAAISEDGVLCIWNINNETKIFEDATLQNDKNFCNKYIVAFMDESSEFFDSIRIKKELNFYMLLVTNSKGVLLEYKVPKYLALNSNIDLYPVCFRIKQNTFDKIYALHMPTSFQINLKEKIKKGDNQILLKNNNFPIMIQVIGRNGRFDFIVNDLKQKKKVQEIPTLANSLSAIDFNRLNPRKMAIGDVKGLIIWNVPSFKNKSKNFYDFIIKRKGFFWKTYPIRITCLQWHPDKENIIVFGTRTGLIYVYDVQAIGDPIKHFIELSEDVYRSLYIYSISWGPNVLGGPIKDESINILSPKQTFDYIYCSVDDRIAIINLENKKVMSFKEIADIFLEKQWTELNWKSDYKYLAIGNKEGSIDIFSNELFKFEKLKHIITINDLFNSPIESISWHPMLIKSVKHKDNLDNDCHNSVETTETSFISSLHFQISVAATENVVKIINLHEFIEKSKNEFDLPLMVTQVHKTLIGHKDRVFRTSWSTFRENYLLSCSLDNTVKIWNCNLQTGEELFKTFYGHFSRVVLARWSMSEPDIVYSGDFDSTLHVWDMNMIKNEKPESIKANESACVIIEHNKSKNDENDFYRSANDARENESPSDQLVKFGFELSTEAVNYYDNIDFIEKHECDNGDYSVKNLPNGSRLTKSSNLAFANVLSDNCSKKEEILINNQNKNHIHNDLALKKNNSTRSEAKNRIAHESISVNSTTKLALNKLKQTQPATKKRNELKVKSLLTLSTYYDNSLNKSEHFNDLDVMMSNFKKHMNLYSKNLYKDYLSTDSIDELIQMNTLDEEKLANENQTCLLYGSSKDIENLSKLEIKNHLKNNDSESACLVKLLSTNLKTVIDEATKENQLTDSLVAMSPSISFEYYQKTASNYVDQLIRKGKIVGAASYLLSLFKIKDALDLLVKFKLFKEAIMVAKTRFTCKDNIYVRAIIHALAHDYSNSGNFESEAKCWLSIGHYYEAARVLATRTDSLSAQYAVKCCKIAHRYGLEN